MKILFIGDMYGKAGRLALHSFLPKIKEKFAIDLVIANGENVTHGRGLNIKNYNEIINAGVEFVTLGNHFLDNNEISNLLRNKSNIIRPMNLENFFEGDGSKVIEVKGTKVRITNIIGRVDVRVRGKIITNPFEALEDLLDNVTEKIHIIDIHAEATGEKKSFAKYFDGQVSAVLGTHTHVQTADNQVFKNGTGYISDVGYCGAYDSVLGVSNGDAILFCKDQDHRAITPAESEDLEFSAVYLDIDEETGKCKSIQRIYITPDHPEIEIIK